MEEKDLEKQNTITSNELSKIEEADIKDILDKCIEDEEETEKTYKHHTNAFDIVISILKSLRVVLIIFEIILIISTFLIFPVHVQGTSMYPTLKDGSLGFSSIISRKIGGMKRFDIVVIKDEESNDYLIKRIIGLPGETVEISEDNLYINGILYTQDFLDSEYCTEVQLAINDYFTDNMNKIEVKDGTYFVMGDNRPKSKDSRTFGAIKEENIISKNIFVIFPFQSFGKQK